MQVGIIADLHGNASAWDEINSSIFKDVDEIIIAGDIYGAGLLDQSSEIYTPDRLISLINKCPKPIIAIPGNCDFEGHFVNLDISLNKPPVTTIFLDKKIVIYHGHEFNGDKELMLQAAKKIKADILISGHTHYQLLEKIGNIILLNPGSPTLPLSPSKIKSVAILDDEKIEIIDMDSHKTISMLKL